MAKHPVRSPVGGSVWAHSVGVGQQVVEGATLMIVEVMKTEFPVESPVAGVVTWLAACGDAIDADALVAIVDFF
jgi:biotin carboxyl carrier protein